MSLAIELDYIYRYLRYEGYHTRIKDDVIVIVDNTVTYIIVHSYTIRQPSATGSRDYNTHKFMIKHVEDEVTFYSNVDSICIDDLSSYDAIRVVLNSKISKNTYLIPSYKMA